MNAEPPAPARSGGVRGRLADVRAVLRTAAANRDLRRVLAASAGFVVAEWAGWIAMVVYAYEHGGASVAAAVNVAEVLPGVVIAPLAAAYAERAARGRALFAAYAVPAMALAGTAAILLADGPSLGVFAMAVVSATSLSLTRPAHGSILVVLARDPSELTAANAATDLIENLIGLLVPLCVGVALGIGGAGLVYGAAAAGLVASALAVLPLGRTAEPGDATSAMNVASRRPDSERPALGVAVRGGLAVVARHRAVRGLVLALGAASAVAGALDVLVVVLALDVVAAGDAGVGLLNSALGAGGLVGATVAFGLVGRRRLAAPAIGGLALWSLPLAVIAGAPALVPAIACVALGAAARGVGSVASMTLLQRVTPDDALTRVLGVLEGVYFLAFGIGSAAVAVLLGTSGPVGALIVVGVSMPVLTGLVWRPIRAAEGAIGGPPEILGLLRDSAIFRPLPPPALEGLAAVAVSLSLPADTWVIREGERGDRYYLVATGALEVSVGGEVVRRLGPGDEFGEIALLRDVPRTASVRTLEPTDLAAIEREPFLGAVAGAVGARSAAERLAARRLSGDVRR